MTVESNEKSAETMPGKQDNSSTIVDLDDFLDNYGMEAPMGLCGVVTENSNDIVTSETKTDEPEILHEKRKEVDDLGEGLDGDGIVAPAGLCGVVKDNSNQIGNKDTSGTNKEVSKQKNEIDYFASYAKRDIHTERKESMKRFQQEQITSQVVENNDIYHARAQTKKDGFSGIASKIAFARTSLEKVERDDLVSLLRRRSMHLPGNNWYQDWIQFIRNNHPLLGICLRHPLHPLRTGQRIYILIASVSFGLLATNLVYFYYIRSSDDFDESIFRIYLQVRDGEYQPLEISHGMISLWLTNGVLHAAFDVSLWHLSACTCFSSRNNFMRLQKIGSFAVVAIAGTIAAISSAVIVWRALIASGKDLDEDEDLIEGFLEFEGYTFLLGYLLELCVVYSICYPMLVTIMFTGILGCFPGLGGRPRDVVRYLNRLLDERNHMYRDFEIV